MLAVLPVDQEQDQLQGVGANLERSRGAPKSDCGSKCLCLLTCVTPGIGCNSEGISDVINTEKYTVAASNVSRACYFTRTVGVHTLTSQLIM